MLVGASWIQTHFEFPYQKQKLSQKLSMFQLGLKPFWCPLLGFLFFLANSVCSSWIQSHFAFSFLVSDTLSKLQYVPVGSRAIFRFVFLVPYSVTSLVQVGRIKRHFCFFFLIPLIVTNLIEVGRIESHGLQWDIFFFFQVSMFLLDQGPASSVMQIIVKEPLQK